MKESNSTRLVKHPEAVFSMPVSFSVYVLRATTPIPSQPSKG